MSTALYPLKCCDQDEPDVIEVTQQEYDTAVKKALDELGITYPELAQQAREHDFASPKAALLWVTIGDSAHVC